jgi:hypothetical protein
MFLWFVGLAVVVVWHVFHDTAIDYRLVMAGAILPDAADAPFGRVRVAHTLLFSVGLLAAVMLATRGRRRARRRLLALPVGTFLHLVLDGVWAHTRLFWWPLSGLSFPPGGLPSISRPVAVLLVQEAAGLAAVGWWWRRFRLGEPERRQVFWRTGRLGRDIAA